MAATVWKGHLTFGLVSIPVKLFRAARTERIPFHRLNRSDASRVRQQFVSEVDPEPENAPHEEPLPIRRIEKGPVESFVAATRPAESVPIPRAELVKGFEYEKDRYVVIEDRDLDQIAPKTSREMEILEFVKFAEIDPVYLDASWYVAPDRGGEKPYSMLFGALRQTGYVALARIAMHNRERVAVIRPGSKGILMHTLYFATEVRKDQEFQADTDPVSKKEMDLAVMLIEALAATFEPEKLKDTYREKLQVMIDAKIRSEATVATPAPAKAEVADIVAALKNSLAQIRKPVAAETARKGRKSGAGTG